MKLAHGQVLGQVPSSASSLVHLVGPGERAEEKGSGLIVFVGSIEYALCMPRTKRVCPAGEVFHVLNRAVARMTIFEKPEDYLAFQSRKGVRSLCFSQIANQ